MYQYQYQVINSDTTEGEMEQCLNEIFSKDVISFQKFVHEWDQSLKDKSGEWYMDDTIQFQSCDDTRLLDLAEMSDDMDFFEDDFELHQQFSIPHEKRPKVEVGEKDKVTSNDELWTNFKIDVVGGEGKYTTASCKYGKIWMKNTHLMNISPQHHWSCEFGRWLTEKEVMEEIKYPYVGRVKWMGPHCQLPWRYMGN